MTEPLRSLDPTLYDYDSWILWRKEERDGNTTKIPYTPTFSGFSRASTTDPDTWASYTMAHKMYERRKDEFDGLGFVFSDDDPYTGVDLDDVLDPNTKEITDDVALMIVEQLNSYTEVSPSGTGLHIIVEADLPEGGNRKGKVEMYNRDRYFTISGDTLSEQFSVVRAKQRQLNAVHAMIFPKKPTPQGPAGGARPNTASATLDETEVLERIRRSKKAGEFEALWAGDISGHDGRSEATLALVNILGFFAGGDEHLVDSLFRQSGLMRDKWDDPRPDNDRWGGSWGRGQIRKALGDMPEFYTPPRAAPEPSEAPHDSTASTASMSAGEEKPTKKQMVEAPAVPFPVEAMPEGCKPLIEEATASLGCAPEFVALPMLAALSQAIGASRVAQVKRKYKQMASLFLAVVGSPGSMKTPAASPALEPVKKLQQEMKAEYAAKKRKYEQEMREYEVEKAKARAEKEAASAPPTPPTYGRTWAADTTLEALVGILEDNPRSILLYRDELAGWIRSMDQYKGGSKGSDRQNWLSLHDGVDVSVDRKSRENDPITVANPFVTVFGGIQPRVLGEMGGGMEDGLMDRFLFAYPATRYIEFSDVEITRKAEIPYENLYDSLWKLELHQDENGVTAPKTVTFSFEALALYRTEYNRLGAEMYEPGFPPKLEAQWSKARGHIVRLALILAMSRVASTRPRPDEQIEREDVEGAITLMRYFHAHARRVYGVLEEVDPETIFSGDLTDFLKGQDDSTWTGQPQELLEDLEAFGCSHVPEVPERLTRLIQDVAKKNPNLKVQRSRTNQGRTLRIQLLTPETYRHADSAVHADMVDTPSNAPDHDSTVSTVSMSAPNPVEPEENATESNQPSTAGTPRPMQDGCINHRGNPDKDCYLCNPDNPRFNRARKPREG